MTKLFKTLVQRSLYYFSLAVTKYREQFRVIQPVRTRLPKARIVHAQ